MRKVLVGFCLLVLVSFSYAETSPEKILSQGELSKDALVKFLMKNNSDVKKKDAEQIVELYISEANDEDVNYEIAFAQMCYHTKYLSFNKTFAKQNSNNFFGVTSFNNYKVPYVFDSSKQGVRAHIQHLKGYATKESLNKECVDPRYYKIEEIHGWGSAPTIDKLSGKWAGAEYAKKIKNILDKMHAG